MSEFVFGSSAAVGEGFYFGGLGLDGALNPELLADFLNDYYRSGGAETTFADLFTFNRASTATYFDANGNLQTAAIGEARLDHDPATGAPLGLLVEPQRTNLITQYECKDGTGWVDSSSVSTNLTLNALGVFDGVSVASQGSNWHRLDTTSSQTYTSGTTYSFTTLYRAGTSGRCRIVLRDTTAATEIIIAGVVGSLSVISSAAGSATVIEDTLLLDGQTRRVRGTFTPNFTGISRFGIGPDSTTIGETIIALGCQIEEGDYPTSLIPANGSTVTRVADDCSVALSKFGFNTSEGTVVVDAVTSSGLGSGVYNHVAFRIRDEAAASYIQVRRFDDGANIVTDATIVDTGASQFDPIGDVNGIGHGENFKAAVAWKVNDFGFSTNGGATETDNSGTVPTSLDTLEIGSGTGGDLFWAGHIKLLRYFPTRLSDATLQEGST